MPHLCGSLPFIDHAAHMRNDHFTEIEVETEVEPIEETNPITLDMGVHGSQNYKQSK